MAEKKTYKTFQQATDILDFTFTYNDSETAALRQKLSESVSVTEDDLRRVSLWKSNRVLAVTPETLELLNSLSLQKDLTLDAPLVEKVIESLVDSQGIGFPMASAILKFIKPSVFPIIDVRAYRALTGQKITYSSYSLAKYIEYSKALTRIAHQLNRPLCEIDEQLYCFDEKHNGKI